MMQSLQNRRGNSGALTVQPARATPTSPARPAHSASIGPPGAMMMTRFTKLGSGLRSVRRSAACTNASGHGGGSHRHEGVSPPSSPIATHTTHYLARASRRGVRVRLYAWVCGDTLPQPRSSWYECVGSRLRVWSIRNRCHNFPPGRPLARRWAGDDGGGAGTTRAHLRCGARAGARSRRRRRTAVSR
eukprot:COSAG01_NODE_1335_length_10677_cov_9.862356_3_plen_188_part_00